MIILIIILMASSICEQPAPIMRAPEAASSRDWGQGEVEVLVEIIIVLWLVLL